MLKKTIKYTDFNGDEREENFYFNLSKSELTEMELEINGGMSALLQQIIDTKDARGLLKIFKKIILASYGEKSADGKYFRKLDADGHQLSIDFVSSPAFDELFLGLFTDTISVADFVKGLMPADLAQQVEDEMAKKAKEAKDSDDTAAPVAIAMEVASE
jgi:hypothetical protein